MRTSRRTFLRTTAAGAAVPGGRLGPIAGVALSSGRVHGVTSEKVKTRDS